MVEVAQSIGYVGDVCSKTRSSKQSIGQLFLIEAVISKSHQMFLAWYKTRVGIARCGKASHNYAEEIPERDPELAT